MSAIVTPLLTTLWNGDSATTPAWSTTPTLFTDRQIEGTGCLGLAVSNTTTHTWITITSTNLQNTGIYIWMLLLGASATKVNGGARIVLGDGTNRRAYYVGGSDFAGFQRNAWSCYMLDTANLPTNFAQLLGAAEPNIAAITEVGVGFTTLQKALGGVANCFWDVGRYGTGLRIEGGTSGDTGTFIDVFTEDSSTSSGKAYGIIRQIQPGIFGVQGSLTFGSVTGNTYFKDINSVIAFEDNGAGNNFYNFNVTGNTGSINSFVLGDKLGAGDNAVGINGCTIQSSGPQLKMSFTGNNVDIVGVYGSTFTNIDKDIDLSTDSTHEMISVTFNQCGEIISNKMLLRNINVISTSNPTTGLLWNNNINIKNSSFIGNTSTGNTAAIEISSGSSSGNTFVFDNLTFSSNKYDIYNNMGTGITINAINGSNPTTYTGNTVTINNPITLTIDGLIADSEVRIYRVSDNEELAGEESTTTTFTYQYNYGGDVDVDIVIVKETYEYLRIEDFTLTNNNTTIPVQQRFDRNYINPT